MKSKLCLAMGVLAVSTMANAANINPIAADSVKWQATHQLPPGAEVAVLAGDPTKAEPFVARVKLPANYVIPPHSHPVPEYDTVLSGALYVGTGKQVNTDQGTELPAGSFVKMPTKVVHYSWTKEETILQISGVGPWGTHYSDNQLNKKYF